MAKDRLQVALDYIINDDPLVETMKKMEGMTNVASSHFKKMSTFAIGAGVALSGSMLAFGKSSITAAQESIEGTTKLEAVLKNVKGVTDEQITSIGNYANELQKLGVVDGDVAISGMQQLGTFQLQADTLKKLMPGMNDLLAQQKGLNATTEDAANIGNLFGKVMNGQVGALSRVGISFTEAQEQVLKHGTESERAAMLSKVLELNVGGVNKALLQTDAGKIQAAKNSFGDMQEEIGAILLPMLGNFATWFTDKIPIIQESLLKLYTKFTELQAPLKTVMDTVKAFTDIIIENKDIIAVLVVGLGAYYLASLAVLAINTAIGTYTKIMTAYSMAQLAANEGLTFSQWALNAAMKANPVGLIVLGITALAAGLIYAYKESETFRGFIDGIWESIKNLLDPLKKAAEWVGKLFGGGSKDVNVNTKNTTTTSFGVNTGGIGNVPKFRTGTDFVPNDTLAQLHYGERVLTKSENEQYSKGQTSSSPSINISINAVQELGNEIKRAIQPIVETTIKNYQTKQLMKMGIAGGQ